MPNEALPSHNAAFGFYGTIGHHADADEVWALAFTGVRLATGCADKAVRDFLDSRHGRHFADDVANGLTSGMPLAASVSAAITRWMGWRIGRRTERETGIPRGLPYLTGFVTLMEIEAVPAE